MVMFQNNRHYRELCEELTVEFDSLPVVAYSYV